MAVGGNMIAALLFTGLAVVFALLRLATRTFIVRYLGIDDLLLGLALLSTIALSGLIIFRTYLSRSSREAPASDANEWP